MKKILTLLAVLFSFTAIAQPAPDYSKLSQHPRLILKGSDIELVRKKMYNDPAIRTMHYNIESRANRCLNEVPCERIKTGKRLLSISRKVLERVSFCSYAYLISGNEIYAERAEKEMLAAANFIDWNPSHFLDVGEMTAALSIGYDWLYDWLSEESRAKIEEAILNKGLNAATTKMWWYRGKNNWNQVCNGGMVMGALAIFDKHPEVAKIHIERALKSNPIAQECYGPDGVYPEGYGYWEYGTSFELLLIESLRTALGSSFGLEDAPGFLESAKFMNYMVGPTGSVFNFSDCGGPRNAVMAWLYWFALETGDMSLVYRNHQILSKGGKPRGIDRIAPIALLFAARCDASKIKPIEKSFWAGNGEQPVFVYRSGFNSKYDTYLAAKGGSASLNHAHMDSGSFIYEWGGVRWAIDLGSQSYYSLEKLGIKIWKKGQNSERWSVYRLNNYPHNTLTVNGELHRFKGNAKMVEVYNKPNKHGAKFDMSSVLGGLSSAYRTIYADKNHNIICIDKMQADNSECNVSWNMSTGAKATIINDRTISLKQNNKEVIIRAISPSNAKAYIKSNDPGTEYDAKNKNTCRVGFTTSIAPNKSATFKVKIEPQL